MFILDSKKLYDFLYSKGIRKFFHANTVVTSCTYIEHKGLMSRGFVERYGFNQTEQPSDQLDKKFDVWNDIFLDIVDLHGYFPRQNSYGPVCFVLDLCLLLDDELQNICITKNNPMYWKEDMLNEDRYYSSVDEYAYNYENIVKNHDLYNHMITIHDIFRIIPFEKYLIKIVLDNPMVSMDDVNLYECAKQKLSIVLDKSGLGLNKLETRSCRGCFCHENYRNQFTVDKLKKFFL